MRCSVATVSRRAAVSQANALSFNTGQFTVLGRRCDGNSEQFPRPGGPQRRDGVLPDCLQLQLRAAEQARIAARAHFARWQGALRRRCEHAGLRARVLHELQRANLRWLPARLRRVEHCERRGRCRVLRSGHQSVHPERSRHGARLAQTSCAERGRGPAVRPDDGNSDPDGQPRSERRRPDRRLPDAYALPEPWASCRSVRERHLSGHAGLQGHRS